MVPANANKSLLSHMLVPSFKENICNVVATLRYAKLQHLQMFSATRNTTSCVFSVSRTRTAGTAAAVAGPAGHAVRVAA